MSWPFFQKESVLNSCQASRRCFQSATSRLIHRDSFPARKPNIAQHHKMEDALQTKVAQLQAELDSLHKAITVLNQLAAELDIHTAMQNVRQVALELLDCERVTLFLIFERRGELRAMIDQNQILRIPFGEGIAGLIAQTGGSMNLPDVYAHPMFNKKVDRITGFRTRSMLCMAVSDMTGKNVAVLQALNKNSGQPFTPADERHLKLFGTHLGNTLVKAKLHETAKREKERLQAIYTCFKTLNAAEEVGQMVVCATAALERHIIHAERVLFFLVDKPRGELWLHTHEAEPMRLRVGQQGGVAGLCAETKKPQSWAEFDEPSSDPCLGRLPSQLVPGRIKSVLVQPIHGTNHDRVLAVVLALNKREAEGTSDIFFEPFFTDADCDAMALFAYEVGDLLSERTLELSLLSALSVVGHDGAHPNASEQPAVGGVCGADGGGGDGSSTSGGGPGSGVSLSGDEDFIRSRLLQMYLPEYKMEAPGAHSAMFSRNSFSAATATANQMRASMDRKRAACLSMSLMGDGGPAGAKRFGSGPGSGSGLGSGSGFGITRRSDLALPSSRMSLAVRAAAARSFGCSSGSMVQHTSSRSLGGTLEDGPGRVVTTATAEGRSGGGSPHDVPNSPLGGLSDGSGDLPLLPHNPIHDLTRSRSSTQAEHPKMALRYGGGGGGGFAARGGGSGWVGLPCSSGAMSPSRAQLLSPPKRNGWVGGVGAGGGGSGGGEGVRRMSTYDRLMAPWRRPLVVQSAGGAPGPVESGGSAGTGGEEDSNGGKDEEEEEYGTSDSAEAAGTGASGESHRHHHHRQQQQQQQYHRQQPQGGGPVDPQLPQPFGEFSNVHEELRAAAEETLRVNVVDPQALRTHLSCTNLAQARSPRAPCFYSPDQLNNWSWDFTEFTVDELIKLAYDIFIVSGAMEDFELQPKVLRNFLTAVASHYQAIPYHNFNHVCHVLQATYLISSHTRAVDILSPLERLALIIAALCHDLGHDGHSNSFHVNSGSELSRIYNDQSVMENHHCAMTFAILSRPDCNLLAVLSPEEQRAARKLIIAAILCTDMANHFAITQEFQKHGLQYEPDNESDRLLLAKTILHAADIGNAVRPFHVNHVMSRRVHREFEDQAHEEVTLGLPVTFSVDTSDHVMCARVELNFLDYVVSTLWERLVDVLPELMPLLPQLRVNRARYRLISDTGKTAEQVLAEEQQLQLQARGVSTDPVADTAADVSPPAGPLEAALSGKSIGDSDAGSATGGGGGGSGDTGGGGGSSRTGPLEVRIGDATETAAAAADPPDDDRMLVSPPREVRVAPLVVNGATSADEEQAHDGDDDSHMTEAPNEGAPAPAPAES